MEDSIMLRVLNPHAERKTIWGTWLTIAALVFSILWLIMIGNLVSETEAAIFYWLTQIILSMFIGSAGGRQAFLLQKMYRDRKIPKWIVYMVASRRNISGPVTYEEAQNYLRGTAGGLYDMLPEKEYYKSISQK